MGPSVPAPYWRLSAYYFFYFATLGALIPYWGLYLKDRGYIANEIGVLMAVVAGTKIIAPYIWGWIADHSGRRMSMIRLGSVAAVVCFTGVFAAEGLWSMALVMFMFSFFWNAGLPQFEATTLRFLGHQSHRYSHIRLWGSIGFIIAVLCLGAALDRYGVAILPFLLLALYTSIWLATLSGPHTERPEHRPGPKPSIFQVLRRRPVAVVLVASFLMQFSFGPFYAFFSIFLEEHGYTKSTAGMLWALGAAAEIVVFVTMHRLLPAFGGRRLLCLCFAVAAFRWWTIGRFVDYAWVLIGAQLLHAFTFGMFHAVMIHLVHRYFGGEHQGRGQALYSSLSFGAGGALGSYIAGNTWEVFGGSATFYLAAVVAAAGLLVVWAGLRESDTAAA
jgi:PPP family 3-phenylpropionic acid transporter